MKKAVLVVFAIVLVVLGVLLVAPVFIDWNSYRRDVAAALADATGRRVTIAGDLDLSILPLPRLTVQQVSVANIDGATDPDLLRIGELRMELAIAPLLTGRIAVRSLSLNDAAVNLETTADGRRSWDLTPAGPSRSRVGFVAGISVDAVAISNGRLVWRAPGSGPRQLDAIEAALTSAGAAGAMHVRGSAVFEAVPFQFLASIGAAGNDGMASVSAAFDIAGGTGTLTATGRTDVQGRWAAGTVRLTAPDAMRLGLVLDPDPGLALPAWPIAAESGFTLDRNVVTLHDIAVAYGGIRGTGLAELAFGKAPALVAELRVGTMDLDAVLAATGAAKPAVGTQDGSRPAWQDAMFAGALTADLDLSVRAARWRGGVVRDIGASLRLGPEGLAIERMAMKLPGSTSVTLSGIAKPSPEELRLQGDLAVISDNLRAALVWAGAAGDELPSDRLRSFSYTSRIAVTPDAVHLSGIAARLDATRMTGAATIARQVRPSFGLRLRLDRLGLDAYLPRMMQRGSAAAGKAGVSIPGAGRFDANLNLFVDSLTVRGKAVSRVALDARLFDGDVILRRLSVGDLGGATLSVSGKVDDLPGAPRGDLDIVLEAGDAERFAGFMAVRPGSIAPRVGRFRLSGHASGSVDNAAVGGTLEIAGGNVQVAGELSGLDGKAGFDLAVTATHPDSDRVLNLITPGRSRGEIGAMTMKFGLAGTDDALAIRNLDAVLGKMRFAGRIDAALGGDRPKAVAVLSAGLLDMDRLWPAAPRPYADRAAPAPRGSARWSREAIDLSLLHAFDLDLKLRSETVVRSRIRVDRLDLHTAIADGILRVDRLTGTLFGGTIEAAGRIDTAAPATDITASVSGRDIAARHALDAIAAIDRVEGPMTFSLSLSATGHNPFDLVSSLSGRGALSGKLRAQRRGNEPIPAGAAGDAVDALLKAFADAPAALSADLRIENGTARTGNLLLDGDVVGALTLGAVDLPGWRIDSTTTVQRQEDDAEPPDLVVRISGPLGDPAVRLSGASVGEDPDEAPAPEAAPVISVEPAAPAAEPGQGTP